jgi:hypothetical protein
MIDTFMALWNRGSRHRVVKILFMFVLVCISLSLFLVAIIIPGWILFTQGNNGMMTISADDETPPSPSYSDNRAATPTPTQTPAHHLIPAAQTPLPISVTPTPRAPYIAVPSVPALRPHHIKKPAHRPHQIIQPVPAPLAVKESRGARERMQSHVIYSGRPSGSVSHRFNPAKWVRKDPTTSP